MNNNHWSVADDEYLIEHYGKVDIKQLSTELGRTEDAIRWRASDLDLTKKRKEWTKKELDFLYENMSSLPYKEIAKKINKTYRQVAHKIYAANSTKTLTFRVPAKHASELRKRIIALIKQYRID